MRKLNRLRNCHAAVIGVLMPAVFGLVGATKFQREGEKLSLGFLDGGGAPIMRFTLTPE